MAKENQIMKKALWLLFSFDGCVGRAKWWVFEACWIAFYVVLISTNGETDQLGMMFWIFFLFSLWPKLAVTVKRWHDRGKHGYWVFINLLPVVGPIWSLVELGFLGPTDDYTNEYYHGEDPWAPIPKIVPRIVSSPSHD